MSNQPYRFSACLSYITNTIICIALAFGTAQQLPAQQPSVLNSQGVIYNTGVIKIFGDASLPQDTILGRVEYLRNRPLDTQMVAHTTYFDVYFEGSSKKLLRDISRPLVSANLFSSADTNTIFDMLATTRIEVRGTVRHDGLINPGQRFGLMRMNGTALQDVSGQGIIPVAEVDNAQGIQVTRGGGLRIAERLDLQNGRVDNTANDNLRLNRGAWIWRNDGGSMSVSPVVDQRMNIRYYGVAPQLGGPELVQSTTELGILQQDNTQGLTLPWDAWVNDSLILRGHIFTEESDTVRHTLFFKPSAQPLYVVGTEEVNGTLVRTTVSAGQNIVMNNRRTSLLFADVAARGPVERVSLRVKPLTIPEPVPVGADKVKRYFQFEAQDVAGAKVADSSFNVQFGYAWRAQRRDSAEGAVEETPGPLVLKIDSLSLERFIVDKYTIDGISALPTQSDSLWRFSTATNIQSSGDFAIGLSTYATIWVLRTKLFLEGAMRSYPERISTVMSADLVANSLLPTTPPPLYPYTLDPSRSSISVSVMPDSIVDWILVEFRTGTSESSVVHYQTGLLTSSGVIVDPSSMLPLPVRGIAPGQYHIVFRHRNHLAVMTEDAQFISPTSQGAMLDLTRGIGVFGGASALKVLGLLSGQRLFGLVAGDVTQDGTIARDDQNRIWDNISHEAYITFDTDLDGILSTRDWNLSWNNRGRSSAVPR